MFVLLFIVSYLLILQILISFKVETGKSQWGNSTRILRQIIRDEGSYGALYRGIGPNMVGNSISWALYFLWYELVHSCSACSSYSE
jgi:hypothetical protein